MDIGSLFTIEELNWIRDVLEDKRDPNDFTPVPSYFYRKKTIQERESRKHIVRNELDELRFMLPRYTPEQLFQLKDISDFPGIYVIYNSDLDKYYVGKSKHIIERSIKHFYKGKGNPKVYKDYRLGYQFIISLIPLDNTQYQSLNDLEDNAIRAYDSFENGYNRNPGNIMDKPFFRETEEEAAYFILDKIKDTDEFQTLTNQNKRFMFTNNMMKDIGFRNTLFLLEFTKLIKVYQKEMKE